MIPFLTCVLNVATKTTTEPQWGDVTRIGRRKTRFNFAERGRKEGRYILLHRHRLLFGEHIKWRAKKRGGGKRFLKGDNENLPLLKGGRRRRCFMQRLRNILHLLLLLLLPPPPMMASIFGLVLIGGVRWRAARWVWRRQKTGLSSSR